MTRFVTCVTLAFLSGLAACGPITPAPDYSVGVAPAPDGVHYTAIPPNCPRWSDNDLNFFDNQPLPQFGCANARNLALMVDQPHDLIEGRPSGAASGVLTSGAIQRYNNNQTRGLLYVAPSSDNGVDATTAPSATSALTGETAAPSATAAPGK